MHKRLIRRSADGARFIGRGLDRLTLTSAESHSCSTAQTQRYQNKPKHKDTNTKTSNLNTNTISNFGQGDLVKQLNLEQVLFKRCPHTFPDRNLSSKLLIWLHPCFVLPPAPPKELCNINQMIRFELIVYQSVFVIKDL